MGNLKEMTNFGYFKKKISVFSFYHMVSPRKIAKKPNFFRVQRKHEENFLKKLKLIENIQIYQKM